MAASNLHKASAKAKQFILTSQSSPGSTAVPSAPSLEDAPPPYTTLPSAGMTSELHAHERVTSVAPTYQPLVEQQATPGQQRKKLGYMDFMPQMQQKRFMKENKYESFRLVDTTMVR